MAEGGWDEIYRDVLARGSDLDRERRNARWLDPVVALADAGVPPLPRRALDLGCGLGGDLAYLSERGWDATGLEREPVAVAEVARRLGPAGVNAVCGDLRDPLPFADGTFGLIVSKLAIHALSEGEARALLREAHRVLVGGGLLAFVVNSRRHRELGLQYDYRGAVELEPGYWQIPSVQRRYLFYTPRLARDLLAGGWDVLEAEEGPLLHWTIAKRVVRCLARRLP